MRLFRKKREPRAAPEPQAFDAPLAPAESLAIVGDIHGCVRLLDILLERLEKERAERLIFVGDYVDRGEQSAEVLTRLFDLARSEGERCVFLKGNHEEMMLRFLDDPAAHGQRWLRFGGLQTLASFGIGGVSQTANAEQCIGARDALVEALGHEQQSWLRGLPTRFVSGNVAVVHAGMDPDRPLDQQSDKTLLWGHPDFDLRTRTDAIWVVHGHSITMSVAPKFGRIAVDTGAYASGRLSAALLDVDRFETISATYHG